MPRSPPKELVYTLVELEDLGVHCSKRTLKIQIVAKRGLVMVESWKDSPNIMVC